MNLVKWVKIRGPCFHRKFGGALVYSLPLIQLFIVVCAAVLTSRVIRRSGSRESDVLVLEQLETRYFTGYQLGC
jgi:hypothetical protein